MNSLDYPELDALASKIGTPFWITDIGQLRNRIDALRDTAAKAGFAVRYAMKANPNGRILREMRDRGIWIEAVSGNEILRALRAGYSAARKEPEILFTSDVFRDNALEIVCSRKILPNIGSPGMIRELADAGYRGPIGIRVNPGFGHGHVKACDTGGPGSKHGVWHTDLKAMMGEAKRHGLQTTMLHAHLGTGSRPNEFLANSRRLIDLFARAFCSSPAIDRISLGGGLPFDYVNSGDNLRLDAFGAGLAAARKSIAPKGGVAFEIEPGRFFAAPTTQLIARVKDIKRTRGNLGGPGVTFVMVDAGFVDLVRPAMYGAYHRITVIAQGWRPGRAADVAVAGPLCESGDVFTRDIEGYIKVRSLPMPKPGDFIVIHDAGAYGYVMSSNYNSIGRAPQVALEPDGGISLLSRREDIDDITATEARGSGQSRRVAKAARAT